MGKALHFKIRLHSKKGSLSQRPQSTQSNTKENLCALCVLCDEFLQWTQISIPAALVAVALLLLNGREIAGAALERER